MILYRKKQFKTLLASMVLLSALSSCTDEYEREVSPADGDAQVTFSIQLPGSATPPTRALSDQDENEVSQIDILAFETSSGKNNGTFVYSAQCTGTITTDSKDIRKKTFTVKLRQGDFDLVIIANARSIVSGASLKCKKKTEALALLTVQIPSGGKWLANNTATGYKSIPMWGNIGEKTINEQTNLTGTNAITLTRMVARVDVTVDAKVSDFKLASVHVYNYNTKGSLAPKSLGSPDWYPGTPGNDKDPSRALLPHVPTSSTLTEGPLNYDNEKDENNKVKTEINTAGNKCENEIYIFESENLTGSTAKALTDRTCIVVGGKYGGDDAPTTYYRVDFSKGSGPDQEFLNVLRNHQYIFNITKVTGAGYERPDIAFKSAPINIEAGVLQWNQGGMGNVAFDGQNILSVSQENYAFTRDKMTAKQENNQLVIFTDYKTEVDGESGWKVEKIVDKADGTTVVKWVGLSSEDGTVNIKAGAADIRANVIITVDENDTPQERSAIIWIAAGRLRYPVTVTQSVAPALGIQLLGSGNNPITELIFASPVDERPASQTFIVNWQPKDANLTITNTVMGSNAFPPGMGQPANGTIAGGTGTISYTIQPPAIKPEEVDPVTGNPFIEKVTKVDFKTSNAGSNTTENLYLRQINYNLLTDVKDGYVLNGQTETLNVRSNFDWKITAVKDVDNILQNESSLMNKTGGNNTTTGNTLTLIMAAKTGTGSKFGKTATITFASQRDGSTWDRVITAIDGQYMGYFGGKLVEKNSVWQFERALYMQHANEASTTWGPTTASNIIDDSDGKSNTYALRTATYPAAYACFKKNNNFPTISGPSDPNYHWYLPAYKQIMATWVVANAFSNNWSLVYWSSTEYNDSYAQHTNFQVGLSTSNKKDETCYVRCVREL